MTAETKHLLSVESDDNAWVARCSCGWVEDCESEQDALDRIAQHGKSVAR